MYIKLYCEKYRLDILNLKIVKQRFLILQNVVVVPAVSVLPAAGLWLTGLYFLLD